MRNPAVVLARPAAPDLPPERFSARSLLHVLFKRKVVVLVVSALFAVASILYAKYFPAPREYEAIAQILVSPQEASLTAPAQGQPELELARTLELLQGRTLMEEVVREIHPLVMYPLLARRSHSDPETLIPTAAARVAADFQAIPMGRSSIVALRFVHEDPVLAARVVNLLIEKYADRHVQVQRNARTEAFFRSQAVDAARQLERSREELRAFLVGHAASGSLPEERNRALDALAQATVALSDVRTQREALAQQRDMLRAELSRNATLSNAFYQESEQLIELELREHELAQTMTSLHPALRDLRDRIAALRERGKRFGDAPYRSRAEQEQVRVSMQNELLRVQWELDSLRPRESSFLARLDEAKRRMQVLRGVDVPLRRLQQRVATDEQTLRLYEDKVDGARRADALAAQRIVGVRTIESAHVPTEPLRGRLRFEAWMGALFGIAVGIGAAVLFELLGGRLDTRENVERALGLPVLMSVMEARPARRVGAPMRRRIARA